MQHNVQYTDEIATDDASKYSIPPVKQISANAPATTINRLTTHGFDCGYTGGVNHDPSSDHSDAYTEILDPESDATSLCELNGDELEENLAALRLTDDTLKQSTCSNGWRGIFGKKSMGEWKKAESNRALGYNGQSKRAIRRKEKEA